MKAVFRSFWPLIVILILAGLSLGQRGTDDNELANHQLKSLMMLTKR